MLSTKVKYYQTHIENEVCTAKRNESESSGNVYTVLIIHLQHCFLLAIIKLISY